jgi:hypothetical protein
MYRLTRHQRDRTWARPTWKRGRDPDPGRRVTGRRVVLRGGVGAGREAGLPAGG